LRCLRDHGDEAERVHAHQLGHRRYLPDQSHLPSFLPWFALDLWW
jgi:hypothetical protein